MNPQFIIAIAVVVVVVALVLTRKYWAPGIGHTIPSVWRIAKITVAEARRRRVLQAILVLIVLIILSMMFFSYLSPNEQSRMLISSGLASITVFGILLSIFVAAFLIPQEMESRTVYAILAKPVRRFEFVLGKYVGAMIILAVIVATMTIALVGVLVGMDHVVKDLPDSAFNPNLEGVVYAAIMSYFAIGVLTSLIIFISTISSTTMTVICAFIIWAVGSLQSQLHDLFENANNVFTKALLKVIYTVLPKLEHFDFRNAVANFQPIDYVTGLGVAGYGVGYVLVVLILASIFFNDRQM